MAGGGFAYKHYLKIRTLHTFRPFQEQDPGVDLMLTLAKEFTDTN
jgi:hypothetical protein